MSRFDKWLPFFEESSEKRDVASWNGALTKSMEGKGLKIIGIVSDRTKALVKLGEKEYLNAFSMPDLFHFQQDIGKLCGLQIGRKHQKAVISKKELAEKKEKAGKDEHLEKSAKQVIAVYQDYRKQTAVINQTVHPFDESNNWSQSEVVNKTLLQSVMKVSSLAENIGINLDLSKATKVLSQIPDIVKGIANWVRISQEKIDGWVQNKIMTETEKVWFVTYLLPLLYW